MRLAWIFLPLGLISILSAVDTLPQVKVTNVYRAYKKGEPNAETGGQSNVSRYMKAIPNTKC